MAAAKTSSSSTHYINVTFPPPHELLYDSIVKLANENAFDDDARNVAKTVRMLLHEAMEARGVKTRVAYSKPPVKKQKKKK